MINDSSILAVIPARGGSKGVLRKNIRKINNQASLLEITIKTSLMSRYIDRVIVTSEDDEIIRHAKAAGADIPFIRPIELAQDTTSGIDPVLHAVNEICNYDYVLLLQPTSPLRTVDDIDKCIEYCYHHQAPSCVSITKAQEHPYCAYTLTLDQKITPLFPDKTYVRRQDLPSIYMINGAIYLAKTDWFKVNKTFITNETLSYEMPRERSIDIDTEYDFFLLETYLKR